MKVLVIGSGGREHALVWKLSQSPKVSALFCAPGNGGIGRLATCLAIEATNTDALLAFAQKESIDLVVVGPENALAAGIVDTFEAAGIRIFGPQAAGARIETSKAFSKSLMAKYAIPTADFRIFQIFEQARDYIAALKPPYVIKADGLCAGKGAYVIGNAEEGEEVLADLLVRKVHGEAGANVIVEVFLPGIEASYLAFADGNTIMAMPPSQDHKTLLDGDKGPNTGGMGAYTPVPFINAGLTRKIDDAIMKRTVDALRAEGIAYKGVLYGGLMLNGTEAGVLEFNARFGDPETQPILFRMESDLLSVVLACAEGRLKDEPPIQWKAGVSLCVVIASAGYPEKPEKGKLIKGLKELDGLKDVFVFHAGTKKIGDEYYTAGGRVLGVTALGVNYADAARKAYEAVDCIKFDGMYYRKDIGRKAIQV